MSRFVDDVKKHPFSLLVSIPKNSPEFARAAESGGADGIKVHLNVKHPASGFDFGSFQEEKLNVEAVLKSVALPVGVVPGAESPVSIDEMAQLKKMGIDFFDIFAHDLPQHGYLGILLGRMICIDSRYTPEMLDKVVSTKQADLFECSVIPHEGYGKPTEPNDFKRWAALAGQVKTPMMVSTQRAITPEECSALQEAGMKGIVIGVVVTGYTATDVENVTKRFRRAIDQMKL